jgi:hypothetical protein
LFIGLLGHAVVKAQERRDPPHECNEGAHRYGDPQRNGDIQNHTRDEVRRKHERDRHETEPDEKKHIRKTFECLFVRYRSAHTVIRRRRKHANQGNEGREKRTEMNQAVLLRERIELLREWQREEKACERLESGQQDARLFEQRLEIRIVLLFLSFSAIFGLLICIL